VFLGFITLLLFVSFAVLGNSYVLWRLGLVFVLFCYLMTTWFILRRGFTRTATVMLLVLYGFIATAVVTLWSITAPFGLLVFGFSIVLSGVMLGSQYALVAAAVVIVLLAGVQTFSTLGFIHQDRSSIILAPGYGDVAGFGVAFLILAMVSWVSGRQVEQSLSQAYAAEAALLKEKQLLAVRLQERTEKLRAAQLKEMQQLYRFAELGQLSTALLHDLANHLTVLTLDIEDLNKSQHSQAITRAQRSIFYLDRMVDQVRSQLQGSGQISSFLLTEKIQESIAALSDKLVRAGVQVEFQQSKPAEAVQCRGDSVRFQQIMTILITNALDAYKKSPLVMSERRIFIELKLMRGAVHIAIRDWGIGIADKDRPKLFKPFYSTKDEGMGIGLFIAQQMLETHFKGTISLSATDLHTEFVVTVPRSALHGS
jgi:signal transduction histidine kinase